MRAILYDGTILSSLLFRSVCETGLEQRNVEEEEQVVVNLQRAVAGRSKANSPVIEWTMQ